MDNINILLLIGAIAFLVFFWLVVGLRHFKLLKKSVAEQWELLDERIRKRHDLLPNLVETVRRFDSGQELLLGEIIDLRNKAARYYPPDRIKIELEHDLSTIINKTVGLEGSLKELGMDTNFLALKMEINDLEQEVESMVRSYNEIIRAYNKQRQFFLLWPIARAFGYKQMNIFEVEV